MLKLCTAGFVPRSHAGVGLRFWERGCEQPRDFGRASLLKISLVSCLRVCTRSHCTACTIAHTIRQSCVYSARTYSGLTIVVWASGKLAIPSHPESGLGLPTWQEPGYARLPRAWVRVVLQASPILFHSNDHSVLAHRGRVCITDE